MENEKPWWVGQFGSEEKVRAVFKSWRELLNSSDAWDEAKVTNLLAIINQYADLEIYPFITSCLDHSSPIVRMNASSALAEYLSRALDDDGLSRLLGIFEKDSDPHVRGAAMRALGRVSRDHQLQQFIPLLLARLRDRDQDNVIRVSAYEGLIYAFDREGEPKYHPFNISFVIPADEQIDWDWIDELIEEYVDK